MSPAADAAHDLRELTYIGLRMASRSIQSDEARRLAAECVDRRIAVLRDWLAPSSGSGLHACGLEHLETSIESGAIIASFQIGPYFDVPMLLADAGFPVTLLMDRPSYAESMERWQELAKRYRGPLDTPIEYVDAEEPAALWRLSRALSRSRIVFGYLDGNTGSGHDPLKTSVVVQFGDTCFPVRKGLAHLAARSRVPLIPAVCGYSTDSDKAVMLHPPVRPAQDESESGFCARAVRDAYGILAETVSRDPACWEQWCRIPYWTSLLGYRPDDFTGNYERIELSTGEYFVNLQSGHSVAAAFAGNGGAE